MRTDDKRRAVAAGTLLAACLAPHAARAETWTIVPSVAVTETYSDNLALVDPERAVRGWITDLSPALRIDLAGARAKGFLDLRFHDLTYSGAPELDDFQKFLYSRLTLEAVEKWLFVDARAETTQQNRSPFGAAVSPDQPTPSRNRIETTTLQLAPFVRGRLGEAADYLVRYNAADVRTDEDGVPDTRTGEFSARLQSASPAARIGWALDANDLVIRNDEVGTQRDSRVRATVIYEAVPALRVSASGGYERTDFGSPEDEGLGTPGLGLTWTPSERTQLAALGEKRFFGYGHSLLLDYRTPRSAWRVASVKDAQVLPAGVVTGTAGSISSLMSLLLVTAIPDPDQRAAAVRKRLDESGLVESSLVNSGVVNGQPYVYRNSIASVALFGATHAVTVAYTDREQRFQSSGEPGGGAAAADNRQRGITANWAKRLTPLTTLTFLARALKTDGLAEGSPNTRQTEYGVVLSSRMREGITASLGVRRVDFDSSEPLSSYRENAVFATVSFRP